jgi:hypothetical protein
MFQPPIYGLPAPIYFYLVKVGFKEDMVRCENCVLLETVGDPGGEFWNRCNITNATNLDVYEERECIDFQPGP